MAEEEEVVDEEEVDGGGVSRCGTRKLGRRVGINGVLVVWGERVSGVWCVQR